MTQKKGKRGMSLHTHVSDVISTNYSSHKCDMTFKRTNRTVKSHLIVY